MKYSQVYLKAAKLVDSNKQYYSCNAICAVTKLWHPNPLSQNYCSSMGFEGANDFSYAHGQTPNDAARKHRVLLLLLASAIAESEGR